MITALAHLSADGRRVLGAAIACAALSALFALSGLCALPATATARSTSLLTPVHGSPFATGRNPASAEFSPRGGLLAVANTKDGTISMYAVGPSGALTPVAGSPFSAPGIRQLTFSHDGGLLAAAATLKGTVSVFNVGSTGRLTQVAGSPFSAGAPDPIAVAFSPDGRRLAASDLGSHSGAVSMFAVASSGALTPVAGSPFAAGLAPAGPAFSPAGTRLAVPDQSGHLLLFSVAADGTLARLPATPELGFNAYGAAFSPVGDVLAVANDSGLSMFTGAGAGTPTAAPGSPFIDGGVLATALAFSPNGALVAGGESENDSLELFWVAPNGSLTIATGPLNIGPTSGTFSPDGRFVAASFGGGVNVYAIGHRRAIVTTRRTRLRRRRARVSVSCINAPPGQVCRGRLALSARLRGRTRALGGARFAIGAGAHRRLTVRLTRSQAALIAARPGHRVRATATATMGGQRSDRVRVVLVAP